MGVLSYLEAPFVSEYHKGNGNPLDKIIKYERMCASEGEELVNSCVHAAVTANYNPALTFFSVRRCVLELIVTSLRLTQDGRLVTPVTPLQTRLASAIFPQHRSATSTKIPARSSTPAWTFPSKVALR